MELTLRAANCFFSWSDPLETLSVGESFTVRFKPLGIDEVADPEWASTIEFWLDRVDEDEGDAIGLVLVWQPDSEWLIEFFNPEDGFGTTGRREPISVGGRFREVTYVRSERTSEWQLDGVRVARLSDDKAERRVYTRVVGTDALFQFETGATTLKALRGRSPSFACMGLGRALCARDPGP